jgi:uncharacterized membrane protein YdbT with pleckstrin-like domain
VSYLTHSERVMLHTRRHYATLLPPLALTVAVVAAAALLGSLTSPYRSDHPIDTLLGAVAIAFVVRFLWRSLLWWCDRVMVTDERMLEISGILTRRVASTPLSKLTDLTYRRSLAGRLLGYGQLVLETPGQHQALTNIDYLPHPDDFYRTLTELVMSHLGPAPAEEGAAARRAEDDDTGPLPRVIV